ncbi:MAG TPA: YfiR family protein [Opitutus sp.]|nr:YfiR family protein [Opitutus sp.]
MQAAPTTSTEYDIKAVFLLNFTRFIEWPDAGAAGENKPIVIGVLGDDPFGQGLDHAVRGERVNNRPIVVKRIARLDGPVNCAALFISRSERHRIGEILERLKGQPVLTVSDIPQFAESGGMVGLVSEGGKIRLRINVEVAKAANLAISSKLLRPAQIVSTKKSSRFSLPMHRMIIANSATR